MKIQDIDQDAKVIEKNTSGFLRLDLACGNNKQQGFIGVDVAENTNADIICDLNTARWMFINKHTPEIKPHINEDFTLNDSCVSEIFCSHFIEHVDDIKIFMEECYRVLIPDGIARFIAPYYSSIRAMQDFTHKRFISENTFLYFNHKWITDNKLEHYDINCNFNIDSIQYIYSPEWKTRSKQAQEWARQHYINAVMDINITLRALK